MDRKAPIRINEQIYEQATAWFVECRAGDLDAAGRRELDQWLRKSPEHLSAYIEIAAIWNEGPALDPDCKWDRAALLADVADERDNVVPLTSLPASTPAPVAPCDRPELHRRPLALAAGIAALAVVTAGFAWLQLRGMDSYATAIGEQRSIALEDGSTVELNSRSRIHVRYTAGERSVELIEGQALFRVAKDPARPFVVASEDARVRAVGTQFDVYRKSEGTIVTVVEGRVALLQSDRDQAGQSAADASALSAQPLQQIGGDAVLLAAGEQATVTRDAVRLTAHPNIQSATAWTQRQLVFDHATLREVADEFNRYNQRLLVVEDAAHYGFHISGVFSSTDPGSLVRFLRTRPGVRVIETASEIRVQKISPER